MQKTETRVLTVHVPIPLADRIDRLAKDLNHPRSWVMKQALLAWVTHEEGVKYRALLEAGYRAMAADKEREAEAQEWCDTLIGDATDETR